MQFYKQVHFILPVIIMDPSAGHKNRSSSVSVLLNIAGVDANLQKEMISINEANKKSVKEKTTKFP